MREYVISMIAISVICFVSKELLSATELSGYISFISGVCIFLVALTPLFNSITEIKQISFESIYESDSDTQQYEEIFEGYVKNAELELIKRDIRQLVSRQFSLDESEIRVYIKYDSQSEKKLQRVTVSLLGSAVFANSNEIKAFVEDKVGCETVVVIGE